jgi:hypothetical protein
MLVADTAQRRSVLEDDHRLDRIPPIIDHRRSPTRTQRMSTRLRESRPLAIKTETTAGSSIVCHDVDELERDGCGCSCCSPQDGEVTFFIDKALGQCFNRGDRVLYSDIVGGDHAGSIVAVGCNSAFVDFDAYGYLEVSLQRLRLETKHESAAPALRRIDHRTSRRDRLRSTGHGRLSQPQKRKASAARRSASIFEMSRVRRYRCRRVVDESRPLSNVQPRSEVTA